MYLYENNEIEINKVDFLFVYEVKARELESLVLLACELEKRGYSVAFLDWWNPVISRNYKRIAAEVLVTASVYKDESLNRILAYVKGKAKVLNMQWEQVYCVKDLTNPRSPWRIEGKARTIHHLSWGEANRDKLRQDGVPDENIHVVGNITMDLLRTEFASFYKSKEELISEYDLDHDKKICLFISSFSWIKMPENMVDPELQEFMDISIKSQERIFEWFNRLLRDREDITFIYRPHPVEADNSRLHEIEKKFHNFHVIGDYSVKQWIVVSDVIYNWYSTSMAEIYFAHKSCHILRPYSINEDYEITEFIGGKFIDCYEDFLNSIDEDDCKFPISERNVQENYYIDENEATFKKIANICESVYHGNSVKMKYHMSLSMRVFMLKMKMKKTYLGNCLLKLKHNLKDGNISEKDEKNQRYNDFMQEMADKNLIHKHEMEELIAKYKSCMG